MTRCGTPTKCVLLVIVLLLLAVSAYGTVKIGTELQRLNDFIEWYFSDEGDSALKDQEQVVALLVAGNYAEARLAMDHIPEEKVKYIAEGDANVYKLVRRHTKIYMYGTYEKRKDYKDIVNLINLRLLVPQNVLFRDGHWKGEL